MPKLSIIVPVYNTEIYLTRCLESVISQTFSDFELIIVEDGSTDNSRTIIESYLNKDARIKAIFHEHNQGIGAARNDGLKAAQGKFIAFVDSDDWLEPEMYEKMLAKQKETNADIIECNFFNETIDGHSLAEKRAIPAEIKNSENADNEYFLALHEEKTTVHIWNKIYRSSIIKENNISFIESQLCEDIIFNLYATHYAGLINAENGCYYHYQHRTGSLSRQKANGLIEKIVAAINYYISITGNDTGRLPANFYLFVIDQISYALLNAFLEEQKPILAGRTTLKKAARIAGCNRLLYLALKSQYFNFNKKIFLFFFTIKLYWLASFISYLWIVKNKINKNPLFTK